MARSVWKGPFVESYVLKKAEAAREDKYIVRSRHQRRKRR